ncbi:MAG: hypothetical protein WC790_02750 [Candidatus Paceibacterota bacterium]|jgi:hypothetical protein
MQSKRVAIKRWGNIFLFPPVLIGLLIAGYSFRSIYSSGLFPQGQVEGTVSPPFSLLDRIAEIWLGGAIGPTGERVCISNKNRVFINGNQIVLPDQHDPEMGAMQIDVNFSDNSHQEIAYIPFGSFKCGTFSIDPSKSVASSTIFFRNPSTVSFVLAKDDNGVIGGVSSYAIDPGQSTFYVLPLVSDVLTTLIKVMIGWWVLVFAVIQSIRIATRFDSN